MNDKKVRSILERFPQIKPHIGAFASGTDKDVAHHLFIAREFLVQLKAQADAYATIRTDTAHGVLAATVRFAVLVSRGMGMTREELRALVMANWND